MVSPQFLSSILVSTFFLQLGIWVRNIAILLYVVEHTGGDGFAVSMISVAEFLPIFIFSFIGGTFADRWNPKKTMVWCDILSAISILFILLALTYGTWKAIFFATIVSSIMSQFSQPSAMKLFKQNVKEEMMQSSMSLFQTVLAIFMMMGPVLGTFVYQQFGIHISIGIMSISFLLSAIALTFIPSDGTPKKTMDNHVMAEMKAGLKYVLSNRLLTLLGISFLIAGLGVGLVVPMGIFIVTEQLSLPESYYQWIATSKGIGMILGGVLSVIASKRVGPLYLLTTGFLVNAVCLMTAGLSSHFWLTFSAEFFIGFVTPAFQVAIQTLILRNTDEAFVGRVNGMLTPLFIGAMVLTMSFSGLLKDMFSVTVMYELAAVFFIISTVITKSMYRILPRKSTTAAHETQEA
ncbi:MFS transporter [Paenibacillus sp. 2TAB23]|uniref:MFS transporter n=1 Tax=Paenibacillus sp. 2TAB23 TaxID=3233004 RepID=UPI003F9972D5